MAAVIRQFLSGLCHGRIRSVLFVLMSAGFIVNAPAVDDGDHAYCLVCHGSQGNGNPVLRAPKISGLESWYIENQLKGFAAGFRGTHADDAPGMEMRAILRMLEDDEAIKAAAESITGLESRIAPAVVQGDVDGA